MNLFKHRASTLLAVAAAASILLISGGASRILTAQLGRGDDEAVLPRGTLARSLPLEIGGWAGRDQPIEESVVKAAACDDYVNRTYVRRGQAIQLWLAFGVRARDLMPHRPEVCYPGQGWTLEGSRAVEPLLADGSRLDCRIYEFRRGELNTSRVHVLNYYIIDGEYSPDVSMLRSKAWRGSGGVHYVAQVQIVAAVNSAFASDEMQEAVRVFAVDAAPAIRAAMPAAPTDPSPAANQAPSR